MERPQGRKVLSYSTNQKKGKGIGKMISDEFQEIGKGWLCKCFWAIVRKLGFLLGAMDMH